MFKVKDLRKKQFFSELQINFDISGMYDFSVLYLFPVSLAKALSLGIISFTVTFGVWTQYNEGAQ